VHCRIFSFHAAIYLLLEPAFRLQLGIYWFVLASSFGMVMSALIFAKSQKAKSFMPDFYMSHLEKNLKRIFNYLIENKGIYV